MVRNNQNERLVLWLGRSLKDTRGFPEDVQDVLGHNLSEVQRGAMPGTAKPLPEYGPGVYELGQDYAGDTYRLIFLLGLAKGVYVLHAFLKKSKSGRGHPRPDKDVIRQRMRDAQEYDATQR